MARPSTRTASWVAEFGLVAAAAFTSFVLLSGELRDDFEAVGIGLSVFAGLQFSQAALSRWLYCYSQRKESALSGDASPESMTYKELYAARRQGNSTLLAVSGITLAFIAFVPNASTERSLLAGIFVFTTVSLLLYEILLQSAEAMVTEKNAHLLTTLTFVEWLTSRLPYWSFTLGLSVLVASVMLGELQ